MTYRYDIHFSTENLLTSLEFHKDTILNTTTTYMVQGTTHSQPSSQCYLPRQRQTPNKAGLEPTAPQEFKL